MEYPEAFRRDVLAALRAAPTSVRAVALAYRIAHLTVTRWARREGVRLPSPAARMKRGSAEGNRRRWGDFQRRRRQARQLRARGATLKQIGARLKLSIAAVHYLLRKET